MTVQVQPQSINNRNEKESNSNLDPPNKILHSPQKEEEVTVIVKSPPKRKGAPSSASTAHHDENLDEDNANAALLVPPLTENSSSLSPKTPSSSISPPSNTIHDETDTLIIENGEHDAMVAAASNSPLQDEDREKHDMIDQGETVAAKEPQTAADPEENTVNHQLRLKEKRPRSFANVRDIGENQMHNTSRRRKRRQFPTNDRFRTTTKKTLPLYQYETTLVRRAIRKGSAPRSETHAEHATEETGDTFLELYGDVSLGMQLTPIGGKIIVQGLIPLKDGRASPAQLTGSIQRGDVLLQINHRSLVNIPFDQLMTSLAPLSSSLADGSYPRSITLRFAAGQGLELLKRREAEEESALRQRKGMATTINSGGRSSSATLGAPTLSSQHAPSDSVDGAADILGLFTMVDQLSGMPVFLEDHSPPKVHTKKTLSPPKSEVEKESSSNLQQQQQQQQQHEQSKSVPLEEAISRLIAEERITEQEQCNSEFFSWNNSLSLLLRQPSFMEELKDTSAENDTNGAKTDLVDLGNEAFKGARKLSAILQKLDRGWSDKRSYRSLSATLSLYSRASTRRRYVLDGKAMPVNFEQLKEADDESSEAAVQDDENDAGSNEEDGDLDGDELLLQLAAKDEDWKKQVIDFLQDVVNKLNNPDENSVPNSDSDRETTSAVSSELGSFLFGDRMTKALMLHHSPQALPPEEITALLFDLTNSASATVPDQIHAAGPSGVEHSSLVSAVRPRKPSAESNPMLALEFVLDKVLPVWLKTFKPLPWDQRRVLWPLDKFNSGESTVESTRSDDSMTIDSMNTKQNSPTNKRKTVKGLREQIEDQELNVETRSETCFLATFYFTQKLLPQLMENGNSPASTRKGVNEEGLQAATTFVKEYGAYLRLHACISHAARQKAQDIIKILLEIAKYDPKHRETMKRFSRTTGLFFYESASLSAVVERLHTIRKETIVDQRLITIQLCSSAYPDVRPWQVERQCCGLFRSNNTSNNTQEEKDLQNLYYKYLSYILHATDGHEVARHDSKLVMEWAELSVRGYASKQNESNSLDAKERRKNFFSVASKASSDHLAYERNLTGLLRLSMEMKEYLLALDLATEILDDPAKPKTKSLFLALMSTLRSIGFATVEAFQSNDFNAQRSLKRIFRLFHRANGMRMSSGDSWDVDIPAELVKMLVHATTSFVADDARQTLVALLNFFAKEAPPKEFLLALSEWSPSAPNLNSDLYPIMRILLRRGANENETVVELSGCLRRVRQARQELQSNTTDTKDASKETLGTSSSTVVGGLWKKKMAQGLLALSK